MKQQSFLDNVLVSIQDGLDTLFCSATAARSNPADELNDDALSAADKQLSARLMRINHAGEVCAQALYRGQALCASDIAVTESMQHAADEEIDHLAWCETRIQELGSHTSYLNPLWYAGSFCIGAVAGVIGDKWSLGFVEETEQQVTAHLQKHLNLISPKDEKTRRILQQMAIDETEHAEAAKQAGAAPLPGVVKGLMKCSSKVMTETTYWL